jgi:hypothetical protein
MNEYENEMKIRVVLATTMTTPMMLNKIFLELTMGASVLNVPKCFKKCLDSIRISRWLHTGTNIIKEELQIQVLLILNNHVVKNNKSGFENVKCYDLVHFDTKVVVLCYSLYLCPKND